MNARQFRGKKKKKDCGPEFCCAHLYLLVYRHMFKASDALLPQSRGPGGPFFSRVLFILTLSWEDQLLPKQEVLTEDVPAWELGSQHCQCSTRSAVLQGRPQDADKPGKESLRDFQQKFTCFLFYFEFCPKNIVICLLWIPSKEHCNHCHSDESAFAGRKKENILLESFSLVHHEVMNLGCFQLVLLLTRDSKTFCPRAKSCTGYFSYPDKSFFWGNYLFYFMFKVQDWYNFGST